MFPKVSVIVPNYNHAPYLRQRLDSIFNQTFQDFEVIILDDCSTDNSKEVVEEYRHCPQISHIIYNETNSGSPFKQWAKGFELAKGEYIWVAESDDWAELNFLEETVKVLDSNKDVALVYSALYIVHETGSAKIRRTYPQNKLINGLNFIKSKMIVANEVYNASCALFRKKNLSDINDDYQSFKGCGDWQFWIEICQKGSVYFISTPLDFFRQHQHNTTQKNAFSGNDLIENWRIYQFLKKKELVTFFHRIETPLYHYNRSKGKFTKESLLWKKELQYPRIAQIIYKALLGLWHAKETCLKFLHYISETGS